MIKIIQEGTKNRIECDYCGALLSYDKSDIVETKYHLPNGFSDFRESITCPQCQNEIIVKGIR